MPSGGSNNCGECWFLSTRSKKPSSIVNNKFRLPYCTLRRILLNKRNPFWTYCGCQSPVCPSQKPKPRGAVYVSGNGYPHAKRVWITEAYQSKLSLEQTKLADFCMQELTLSDQTLCDEFNYSNLPLCVIDAIFSIGVRYESTVNVVNRVRSYFSNLNYEPSINNLISQYYNHDIKYMADTFFNNKQRTSTHNGILKADAVLRFCKVLAKFEVNCIDDVIKVTGKKDFENEIKKIPGQKSGICLNYFYALSGMSDYVKPDRMLKRFAESVRGRNVKVSECHQLLLGASLIISETYPEMEARILDHLVWKYQRGRKKRPK
ncbi:MAG: hypothetical protein ACLQBD_12150 [Syntrophobacteraceae bacterium]